MRPLIRSFGLVCLVALAASVAQAEPGILWVKVLNLKNTPIRKISVGAEGPGSSAITDDRGLARIRLAPQTRPGTWVTLEVSGGVYAFVSPWNRKVPVPPFENESENFVTVYLTIIEKTLGAEHPNVATVLENHTGLLRKLNREAEAINLKSRANSSVSGSTA